MALNPENRIPSTADKNEIFFDRNTGKISYKNSNGISNPISDGIESISDDGNSVIDYSTLTSAKKGKINAFANLLKSIAE